MWDFLTTDEYREWVSTLGGRDRARLQKTEQRLMEKGSLLGRPNADTVRGSKHKNMSIHLKNLRRHPSA